RSCAARVWTASRNRSRTAIAQAAEQPSSITWRLDSPSLHQMPARMRTLCEPLVPARYSAPATRQRSRAQSNEWRIHNAATPQGAPLNVQSSIATIGSKTPLHWRVRSRSSRALGLALQRDRCHYRAREPVRPLVNAGSDEASGVRAGLASWLRRSVRVAAARLGDFFDGFARGMRVVRLPKHVRLGDDPD